MLVLCPGDQPVDGDHDIISERPRSRGCRIEDRLITRCSADDDGLDAPILQKRLQLSTIELVEGTREKDRFIVLLLERVRHSLLRRALIMRSDRIYDEYTGLAGAAKELRHRRDELMTWFLGAFTSGIEIQNQYRCCRRIYGDFHRLRFVGHFRFPSLV